MAASLHSSTGMSATSESQTSFIYTFVAPFQHLKPGQGQMTL